MHHGHNATRSCRLRRRCSKAHRPTIAKSLWSRWPLTWGQRGLKGRNQLGKNDEKRRFILFFYNRALKKWSAALFFATKKTRRYKKLKSPNWDPRDSRVEETAPLLGRTATAKQNWSGQKGIASGWLSNAGQWISFPSLLQRPLLILQLTVPKNKGPSERHLIDFPPFRPCPWTASSFVPAQSMPTSSL